MATTGIVRLQHGRFVMCFILVIQKFILVIQKFILKYYRFLLVSMEWHRIIRKMVFTNACICQTQNSFFLMNLDHLRGIR